MVLSICLTPPHRVDFFCCSRQSSGQDGPSGDRSSHFYQGSARTCPVLHSCTAATLQKRYKKLKFISSSLLTWDGMCPHKWTTSVYIASYMQLSQWSKTQVTKKSPVHTILKMPWKSASGQVAHNTRAYPGFYCVKQLGVILLPSG